MFRRIASASMLLLTLNVMALGDGIFSRERKPDCDKAMQNAPAQHDVPTRQRCNLPWSPACASAGGCFLVVEVAPRPATITAAWERATPASPVLAAPAMLEVAPDHPPPRI